MFDGKPPEMTVNEYVKEISKKRGEILNRFGEAFLCAHAETEEEMKNVISKMRLVESFDLMNLKYEWRFEIDND